MSERWMVGGKVVESRKEAVNHALAVFRTNRQFMGAHTLLLSLPPIRRLELKPGAKATALRETR